MKLPSATLNRSIPAIVLLFLTLWLPSHLSAQVLTNEQATQLANQLLQKQLLNEKGRDELLNRIQLGKLHTFDGSSVTGTLYEYKDISKATLLYFLYEAFHGEFNYRSGKGMKPKEQQQMQKSWQQSLEKLFVEYKGDSAMVKKQFLKTLPEQYQIESRIAAEDSGSNKGWNSIPFPLQTQSNWIHKSRSVLGKTRTRTARDLYEAGLMDEKVYQNVLKALRDSSLVTEEEVCTYAAARTMHYLTYTERKAEQVQLLDTLRMTGVLSEQGYQNVLASYQAYELKSHFDLLAFCEKAMVLDARKYPEDPKVFYPLLMARIQQQVPDFHYQNLSVDIAQTDEDTDLIRYDITLSFKVNGVRYGHTFLHDYIRKDGQDFSPTSWAQVSQEFHKPINKWLTDQASPYRLYRANQRDQNSVYGNAFFGLILMTESQRQAWGLEMSFLSHESHDNRFSTEKVAQLVRRYQELGLFSHLSPQEFRIGQTKVGSSEIENYQDILTCFPKVIHAFDWETGNLENPYEALTQAFSAISRGAFQPTAVQDDYRVASAQGRKIRFSFQLGRQAYTTKLKNEGDWLDPAFLELIEKAIVENRVPGKFYYCLDDGQVTGYIFLTIQQYEALRQEQPELFSMD